MTLFNNKRLDKKLFAIDVERMQLGWYSDAYFINIFNILETLAKENYTFQGISDIKEINEKLVNTGDLKVEMQFFTRRKPFSLIAGVDESLAILEDCTGYFDENNQFINTYEQLEVEAIQDGTFAFYAGDPQNVQPVLKVRGRYRDIAKLETPILGALTEASRVATNVYNVLEATQGKDVLFFPARFTHYKLQALHGYAYSLAVQAYNHKHNKNSSTFVSTDDQGDWWGGKGGGTVAHSAIACFLGDTAETMAQFSRIIPIEVPRIALVDFHNDCVGDTLLVMEKMFEKYWQYYSEGNLEEAKKYKLFAVRSDTSGSMRDISVEPLGAEELDLGVNPRLVWNMRKAIDHAYLRWNIPAPARDLAITWCKDVKIVVTGGFNVEKIKKFEKLQVPVDIYGVGSSLLENCSYHGSGNDFTADIVRVFIGDQWYPMAKVGRTHCNNPNLELIKG
ncbi:nicotinate phosphoribosyltransferase [Desulfotomaculum sp. 1211_IL3151]|uniref:nicotinate phosphoribosyltransferase n=1 Tax=Desulfotomaculum sp. 1211_IL3151 TaxID=3084055 RepID=UPI002FD9EC4C